jgi:hypothetical protein
MGHKDIPILRYHVKATICCNDVLSGHIVHVDEIMNVAYLGDSGSIFWCSLDCVMCYLSSPCILFKLNQTKGYIFGKLER